MLMLVQTQMQASCVVLQSGSHLWAVCFVPLLPKWPGLAAVELSILKMTRGSLVGLKNTSGLGVFLVWPSTPKDPNSLGKANHPVPSILHRTEENSEPAA